MQTIQFEKKNDFEKKKQYSTEKEIRREQLSDLDIIQKEMCYVQNFKI